MSVAEKLSMIAENEQKVYDAGKTVEYDRFWNSYQNNGDKADYRHAFAGYGWTDETFKPKHAFGKMTQCLNMFAYSRVTRIDYDLDASEANQISGMFANSAYLTYIKSVTFGENHAATSVVFSSCPNLVDVTVKGVVGFSVTFQSSPLSVASMKSIIGVLKNYTGTTNEFKFTITFNDDCWTALEADSTAPDGNTWKEYVQVSLGWNI